MGIVRSSFRRPQTTPRNQHLGFKRLAPFPYPRRASNIIQLVSCAVLVFWLLPIKEPYNLWSLRPHGHQPNISLKHHDYFIYFLLFQQNNLKSIYKSRISKFLKLIVNVLLNGTGRSGHLGRPFNYTKKNK